jgi:hypothetical protein
MPLTVFVITIISVTPIVTTLISLNVDVRRFGLSINISWLCVDGLCVSWLGINWLSIGRLRIRHCVVTVLILGRWLPIGVVVALLWLVIRLAIARSTFDISTNDRTSDSTSGSRCNFSILSASLTSKQCASDAADDVTGVRFLRLSSDRK